MARLTPELRSRLMDVAFTAWFVRLGLSMPALLAEWPPRFFCPLAWPVPDGVLGPPLVINVQEKGAVRMANASWPPAHELFKYKNRTLRGPI